MNEKLPNPQKLVDAASTEKVRVRLDMWDYMPAVHVLREKNFTWLDVAAWLKRKGVHRHPSATWEMYHKWHRAQAELD